MDESLALDPASFACGTIIIDSVVVADMSITLEGSIIVAEVRNGRLRFPDILSHVSGLLLV